MSPIVEALEAPFSALPFMRRALAACLCLAFGSGPVGVFLVLRRMSLIGDTLAHAVLPGAALGFLWAGLSLPAMGLGGFAAGLLVAMLSGLVSRVTKLREDASFASFFLISLAAGVLMISLKGNSIDLTHILFGSILAVDDPSLVVMAGSTTVSLLALALLFRGLVAECFDPAFLAVAGGRGGFYHLAFIALAVLNMVSGFQALGTLMAVGLMMLPAIAARFWATGVGGLLLAATGIALVSGYVGLVLSYRFDLPSGPAIVLTAGMLHLLSLAFGSQGGLVPQALRRRHLDG